MPFPSILLVAHEEPIRAQLLSILAKTNPDSFQVANSLVDALRLTHEHPPDIILMDAGMATLDFKLLLSPPPEGKRPPVVILLHKGVCSAEQAQAWRAGGAAGIITSSFHPSTFIEKVYGIAEQTWFARKLADLTELGGPAFVAEMIDAFLQLGTRAIDAIRIALSSGDLPMVARTAHSLKSAAANLGAEVLREAAIEIETEARNNASCDLLAEHEQKVAIAFDRARQYLQQHRSP